MARHRHEAVVPMQFHAYIFTVEGAGRFPLAMLAFERCIPLDNHQFIVAFAHHDGLRRVDLQVFRPVDIEFLPSEAEWSKFGWKALTETVRPVPE